MTLAKSPLLLSYTDNELATVGARLAAEIEKNPRRLWVASGYFGASMWGAIGPALERLAEFRLLVGKDYQLANLDVGGEERRIADLVRQALQQETEPPRLTTRGEAEHVAALIRFLERHRERGEPVVKLWQGEGFLHAKAYVLDGSVGIGSANITYVGLMQNRELVGWRQDNVVVEEVADWFERYWGQPDAVDYTDELLAILRATPLVSEEYTPHDVLIKTLAARYGIDRPPSLEQATFNLKWFQEDAVFRLIRLLDGRTRGALLADAVGLGKTYMALGVIHHYLYNEPVKRPRGKGRPVLLVIPRSLEEMWRAALQANNLDWACEILTIQSFRSDFDPSPYWGADLIVIDEAHRLRGGGVWFRKAVDLVAGDGRIDRRVLLLTATPVNTGIEDLINEIRVLAKNQRSVWAPDVADFERHLKRVDAGEADPFPVLDRAIVRRSRSDILRAQDEARAAGVAIEAVTLPDRRPVHVDHAYGGTDRLFELFARTLRTLELAPYDLERFRRVDPEAVVPVPLHDADGRPFDPDDAGLLIRPGTLAALAAVGLLVRFQSSIEAIRISLRRLDAVLRRYGEALASEPPRLLDLRADARVRQLLADEAHEDVDAEEDPGLARLDEIWSRVLEAAPLLPDADAYDLPTVRASIERDRERLATLAAALPVAAEDGKVAALVAALRRTPEGRPGSPGLAGRKTLVFTQFRDTAVYLERRIAEAGFRVARIDGSVSAGDRTAITAWFDPDRRAAAVTAARVPEPEILVSTDVLAEGHNLQLADCAINYDLHFNPQVAVQRSGRIDRLGSPHPLVWLVSFLPPEALERHIGLLARLDDRFRRIHGLGLGDEQVTTIAGDRPGRTLEQMRRLYRRDDATVLDEIERSWTLGSTDYMRQPLEAFLQRAGHERLSRIPMGVSSVKRLPADWTHGEGVFIAFASPTDRHDESDSIWRFYPFAASTLWGQVLDDEVEIFRAIACREGEPRQPDTHPTPGPTVIDWDLLRRAATGVAEQLTRERSTAQVLAGASERSRRMRTEIRGGLIGVEVPRSDDLLARLLQVRVEDYDGRSGWSRFDDARRRLRAARTLGERRDAAEVLVASGLLFFGDPAPEESTLLAPVEVKAGELRLIAYELLVEGQPSTARR
ncbi:MAG: helicase-related protein [Chloroflexi bacterium]|nr:helicase-related protein [Chloroflexota bacterium]